MANETTLERLKAGTMAIRPEDHRENILSAVLFIIFAGLSFMFLAPKGGLEPARHVPWVFAPALVLLFVSKRKPLAFLVHTVFFIFLCSELLSWNAQYNDSYHQYSVLKPLDILSPYPERKLYTVYRTFEENGYTITKYDRTFHDYTYFPFMIARNFLAHFLQVDTRLSLFLMQLIVAWLLYIKNESFFGTFCSGLVLVSPFVPAIFSSEWGQNSIVVPFGIALIALAYRMRRSAPVPSGFLLGVTLLSHQTLCSLFPFLAIPFWFRNGRKALILGGVIVGAGLLYFIAQGPWEFYMNAIAQHLGYADRDRFLYEKEFHPLTFLGIISMLFNLDPHLLYENYPAKLVGLVILGVCLLALFRKRHEAGFRTALCYGVVASVLALFFTKYSWVMVRYYVGPAMMLLLLDPKGWLESESSPQNPLSQLLIPCVICLALVVNVVMRDRVASSFEFPVGEKITCSFAEDPPVGTIALKREDVENPQPLLKFIPGNRYGWMPGQGPGQWWFVTPPGRYKVSMCDKAGSCDSYEERITAERSFGLRIAILLEETEEGSLDGYLLPNGEVLKTDKAKHFPSIEAFSIQRSG